jgi:nitroimidazol reductase NimA-like FMN-containing flavoprotein (pyridoxamine 5'-phosphate oxidase superfamily)
MTDRGEMLEVIRRQKFLTLAMASGNDPYLATMNYAYDEHENCFYSHCAPKGKKADYLKANPNVWGQVIEDRGYLQGECDHAYRTVQFKGLAEFLSSEESKRSALEKLIEAQEKDPEPRKARLARDRDLGGVGVVKIQVIEMSGKRNPAK